MTVIDLFAGPGGWDVAAHALGIDPLGIEFDDAACATRRAAGLETIQADVSSMVVEHGGISIEDHHAERYHHWPINEITGLIASPPCQAFSMAGKGEGRKAIETITDIIARWSRDPVQRETDALDLAEACDDERAWLVLEPLRWADELRPDWIAFEQVEPVRPVWQAMAIKLQEWGYSTWTGVLSAEQYGVPQTRRRAFLIARKSELGIVKEPPPTHQRYIAPQIKRHDKQEVSLFDVAELDVGERERVVHPHERDLLPWVSMAEALGWASGGEVQHRRSGDRLEEVHTADRPSDTVTARADRWQVGFPRRADTPSNTAGEGVVEIDGVEYRERDLRDAGEPSHAVTEKARSWQKFALRTGNFTAVKRDADGGRSKEGSIPYEREVTEPAPTIATSPPQWTEDRPSPTVVTTRRSKDGAIIGRQLPEGEGENVGGKNWVNGRPATTVRGNERVFPGSDEARGDEHLAANGRPSQGNAVRVSIDEAAILQSFPPNYPWQGSKTKVFQQIGNAVPPLLALAVLGAVVPTAAVEKTEVAA